MQNAAVKLKHHVRLPAIVAAFLTASNASAADQYAAYDDHTTTGMTQIAGHDYVNQDYGYKVHIPPGLVAWMAAAPAPNHGFRILLGAKRSIEVDCSFDSALLDSTEAVADDAASAIAAAQKSKSSTDLGGGPAERVALVGPDDRRRVLIVRRTVGTQGQADATNVVISLETVAAYETSDEHVLDALAKSFAYIQRKP